MSDILIDNKKIYNLELNVLFFINFITKFAFVLFLIGIFQNKPLILVRFNFVVKIILALFLIYRFNKYRKTKIHFTELDRKVCYSLGIYIIIISFFDIINYYIETIRNIFILPYTKQFTQYITSFSHSSEV